MDKTLELLQKAKEIGSDPGVYLMKDKHNKIIYVGKAKNLTNRLKSYFQPKLIKTPKTEQLVKNIVDFETIRTTSEVEALVLELNLIKTHQPKYNIKLKSSGGYPFIKIDHSKEAPYLEWQMNNKGSSKEIFFGPYPNIFEVKETVAFLNEIFKLRTCTDHVYKYRSRPCILFQMNKCSAPCTKEISLEEYNKNLNKAKKVLEGKTKEIIKELNQEMLKYANEEKFEQAAIARDQISKIKILEQKQSALNPNRKDSFSIAEVLIHENRYILGFLDIFEGKIKSFSYLETDLLESLSEEDIIFDFFFKHEIPGKEKKVLTNPNLKIEKKSDIQFISWDTDSWYKNLSKILIKNLENIQPKHNLVDLISLEEIKNFLTLNKVPLKIECMDISNLQGTNSVASKVCFVQGQPYKKEYRKYKIKTVEGANDFESIKEVVKRRFSHPEEEFPDLLVIDGGLQQLNKALEALNELNIQGIDVVGLAKDKTIKDFKKSEIKTKGERIVKPNGEEILLIPGSISYKVLTQIRNESHRFALKYHRELRSKNFLIDKKNKPV